MELRTPKLKREFKTIKVMIECYCRGVHKTKQGLCSDCSKLLEYAKTRLLRCPFKENKPTCVKCPVHCYQPELRQKVKEVMRYAGPRIILLHPILTIRHFIDEQKKTSSHLQNNV